jgi:hypothetical protein
MQNRNSRRPDSRAKTMPEQHQYQQNVVPPKQHPAEYTENALRRAHMAYEVLNSEGFNLAYQELLNESVNTIIDSKPEKSSLRDDEYYRIRGLQDLILKMHGWIATAEQIRAAGEQRNSIA